jgi:hypothetical protein
LERRAPRELSCLADLVETVDGAGEAEARADVEVAMRLDLVDTDMDVESAPRLPRLGVTGSSGSEDILSGEASVGLTDQ